MTQILTQEEIDALIFGMGDSDSGGKTETAPPPSQQANAAIAPVVDIQQLIQTAQKDIAPRVEPKRDYRLYDFRRPEKFSKNQIREVRSQMEILARQFNNIIANLLRFNTEVALIEVGQCNYADLYRTSMLHSIICLFALEENKSGHGILQYSTELAFTMIDRMMGGEGSPSQTVRDLTEFERLVFTDIFQRFIDAYTKALKEYAEIHGKILRIETDEKLIPKGFSPEETFVKCTFEMRFPKNKGFMIISIPYYLIASYFTGGKYDVRGASVSKKPISVNDVPGTVKELKFTAEVEVGETRFTIRDLLALEPGSLLLFDSKASEPLDLYINKSPRFKVKPGYVDKRMGVEIISMITEGKNNE
jgi:flagellar motor switch protein FliM